MFRSKETKRERKGTADQRKMSAKKDRKKHALKRCSKKSSQRVSRNECVEKKQDLKRAAVRKVKQCLILDKKSRENKRKLRDSSLNRDRPFVEVSLAKISH